AEDPRADGIIVTHGTFTTEETAYFLHLCVHTEKPLVVVASQRKHDEIGNDGDRNLLDAIRLVLCPDAQGRGVLGHIEDDQVSFYATPTRRHTFRSQFDIRNIAELPRVDVIAAYVGGD